VTNPGGLVWRAAEAGSARVTPVVLSRARRVDGFERPEATGVEEPAEKWNEEDDRPHELLNEAFFAVDEPEANDEG
jgi:hypothetical protein